MKFYFGMSLSFGRLGLAASFLLLSSASAYPLIQFNRHLSSIIKMSGTLRSATPASWHLWECKMVKLVRTLTGRLVCVWMDKLPGVGIITHGKHTSATMLLVVGH